MGYSVRRFAAGRVQARLDVIERAERCLPGLALSQNLSNVPYCPPLTPTERRVLAIWREVLGTPDIGVHDDFFALGGHSMAAIQIANRMFEEFHVDEPFEHLLAEVTTAADLARRIDDLAPAASTNDAAQTNDDAR